MIRFLSFLLAVALIVPDTALHADPRPTSRKLDAGLIERTRLRVEDEALHARRDDNATVESRLCDPHPYPSPQGGGEDAA